MDHIEALYGTTIHYDKQKYPFEELLFKAIRGKVGEEGKTVKQLSQLHEICSPESLGRLYSYCYEFMDSRLFLDLYRTFIRDTIQPLFSGPIYYQKKPGVRIHLHDTLTVQYHTDEWYGHGQNIVNFWMPLTKAYSNNSLFVASLQDSLAEVRALTEEEASMEEINHRLSMISKPIDLSVGDVAIFGGRVVHGTERNNTEYTRVSLDFRALAEGEDAGTKSITEYYETTKTNYIFSYDEVNPEVKTIVATSYIFALHGFTRFISHTQQRLCIQEFASRNHIKLVAEETEIKTMSHHPMLLSLASGKGTHDIDAVLVYSVLCLPENEGNRRRIFEKALHHSVILFFANENLSFRRMEDSSIIEENRTILLTTPI